MKKRTPTPATAPNVFLSDLNTPHAVEIFRKAADAFNARAMRSKAAARKVSIDEGIHTPSGKLTKRYSS